MAVDLALNFNNVETIYDTKNGGADSLLLGLIGSPSMAFDRYVSDGVRNFLFARPGQPRSGLDLISINIMRGRDHAVQPYNAYRELCGLPRALSFSDLSSEMDLSTITALRSVYDTVDDIDLFPGLTSERPIKGAVVGPTTACLVAEQFRRLKQCDRFYYENDDCYMGFTEAQLQEIRKTTFSSLICANSKWATRIQSDAFTMPDLLINTPINCADFPQIDIRKWKYDDGCRIGINGKLSRGQSQKISPCTACTCTEEGIAAIPTSVMYGAVKHAAYWMVENVANDDVRCRSVVVSCYKIANSSSISDIVKDPSCVIQCSYMIAKQLTKTTL